MNGQYGGNAFEFLISTLVNLYVMVVLLRFLMQTLRVDYYNPVSQFAVKITTPLLKPIRRTIPGIGGIDISTLLLAWLLLVAKMLLFKLMGLEVTSIGSYGLYLQNISLPFILYLAIIDIIVQFFDIFFFVIIVQALLSWVNPDPYNPVQSLLYSLSSPILRPFQRLIPPIAGIDLSPLFALLVLQVIKMILIPPLLGLM